MIKNIGEMSQNFKTHGAKEWMGQSSALEGSIGSLDVSDVNGPKSFGDFLQDSIGKVNQLQNEADVAVQKLASGESKDLHGTLLTVEKAEIAFKMMNQVRTKVIDAYKEIMRMQV